MSFVLNNIEISGITAGRGLSSRRAVRAATVTNGTFATAFSNGQTIDSVLLVTNDRILIKNQSTGTENGVYVVQDSGPPVRSIDFDSNCSTGSSTVFVQEGTKNADTGWICTNDTDIPDVDALNFKLITGNVSSNLVSTNNAIPRWDGTDGYSIQDSAIIIDDNNNISGLKYLQFDPISLPSKPLSNKGYLYKKTGDNGIWWLSDTGIEVDLTAGGGGEATAANVGTGVGWFKDKTGNTLNFKTLITGSDKLTISNNNDDITLSVDGTKLAHSELIGLSDDSHLQYLYLLGRTGGQIVNGGTTASENLTLDSTINANKGYIVHLSNLTAPDGTALLPAYTFNSNTGTGMWMDDASNLTFSANGLKAFEIMTNGQVRISSDDYETLVNENNVVPNKKYVDDKMWSTSSITSGVLPITRGGTNSETLLTNGKLMVSLGNSIVEGTSLSTPTFTSVTLGATTLTASTTDACVLTLPTITDTLVCQTTTNTLTNKTLTSNTNNIVANALWVNNGTAVISTYTASIPSAGQVLTATSEATANWQSIPAAGSNNQVQYNNNGLLTGANKLTIDENGYPVIDTNGVTLRTQFQAGRRMLSQNDSNGLKHIFQPTLFSAKIAWWSAMGGNSTLSTFNFNTVINGTSINRNVATTNLFSSMRRVGFATGNSAGSSAGIRHSLQQFFRSSTAGMGGFFYVVRFGISSATIISTQRSFVGFAATTSALSNADPSTQTNILGFGVDSADSSWSFMHNDGTGTATKDTLIGTFPPRDSSISMFEARIFSTSASPSVYYSLEVLGGGSLYEGSTSTNIPAINTLLAPQIWTNNGTTGTACSIDIVSQYLETEN